MVGVENKQSTPSACQHVRFTTKALICVSSESPQMLGAPQGVVELNCRLEGGKG